MQLLPALQVGGVEQGTIELAAALVRAGHRALVVSAGGALVPALEATGATPDEIEKQAALVTRERATLDALGRDNTDAERAALKAEQDAHKPGDATAREARRVEFSDHFYDRIGALKPPPEKKETQK